MSKHGFIGIRNRQAAFNVGGELLKIEVPAILDRIGVETLGKVDGLWVAYLNHDLATQYSPDEIFAELVKFLQESTDAVKQKIVTRQEQAVVSQAWGSEFKQGRTPLLEGSPWLVAACALAAFVISLMLGADFSISLAVLLFLFLGIGIYALLDRARRKA